MESTKRIAELTLELEKSKINPILISEWIDIKVGSDMEKVIQRMEHLESSINSRLDKQAINMRWTFGIGVTIISIVITLTKLL